MYGAICLVQLMRVFAPDLPYDDDQLRVRCVLWRVCSREWKLSVSVCETFLMRVRRLHGMPPCFLRRLSRRMLHCFQLVYELLVDCWSRLEEAGPGYDLARSMLASYAEVSTHARAVWVGHHPPPSGLGSWGVVRLRRGIRPLALLGACPHHPCPLPTLPAASNPYCSSECLCSSPQVKLYIPLLDLEDADLVGRTFAGLLQAVRWGSGQRGSTRGARDRQARAQRSCLGAATRVVRAKEGEHGVSGSVAEPSLLSYFFPGARADNAATLADVVMSVLLGMIEESEQPPEEVRGRSWDSRARVGTRVHGWWW